MSLFLMMCPEDLKREVSRILHKTYYLVVLDELLLMTEGIRSCFDGTCGGRLCHEYCKIRARRTWTNLEDPCKHFMRLGQFEIDVPRWICTFINLDIRKSIQEIKNDLERH